MKIQPWSDCCCRATTTTTKANNMPRLLLLFLPLCVVTTILLHGDIAASAAGLSRRHKINYVSTRFAALRHHHVDPVDGSGGDDDDENYVVTIDGGSSGSRVHVHRVTIPTAEQPVPSITPVSNKKITPGLGSFRETPEQARHHVKRLLDFALSEIPATAWKNTPIRLKATAGLRSIPADDAHAVLSVCREIVAASPFRFEPHWARVISGTEEGKYSWIAVNYLEGRFTDRRDLPLLGMIEMGGASLQISYPLAEEETEELSSSANNNETIVNVTLDRTYRIYSHSFLGYGLESAQNTMDRQTASLGCYPRGYHYSVADSNDVLVGEGDYHRCYDAMDALLGKERCPEQAERCSINGLVPPGFGDTRFVAFENFFYTTSFYNTTDDPGRLANQAEAFCGRRWNDVLEQYRDMEHEDLLKTYCFGAAYINAVINKGFGIPMDSIEIAHDIGGRDIDWSIGSVLDDVMNNNNNNNNNAPTTRNNSGDEVPTERKYRVGPYLRSFHYGRSSGTVLPLVLFLLPVLVVIPTVFPIQNLYRC